MTAERDGNVGVVTSREIPGGLGHILTTWLCGEQSCMGDLERLPNHYAYRCVVCGKWWDPDRDWHQLHSSEEWRWADGVLPR